MRKIYLPLLLFLLLSNTNVFGQPGCASVTITTNNGNDFSLPCASPCTTLSATAVQTSGETSTYSVSSIPYAPPYAYNTGTPILVGLDDIWSDVINLPFTFCFYGTSYTQILVGANGDISFAVGDANSTCEWEFSSTCPSTDLIQAGNIFGPYHDIDPSVSGALYYAILGSYPCRTFVVNWYQIPMYDCNSLLTTHQTVLYETSNIIEVYMQSIPLCSGWNGGNAVVGIQNPAGTAGLVAPGRNTSAWSTTNEAWRFTPTGSTTVGITWFQGATQIGTGNSINVCPAGPTTYTAQATYSTCFGVPVTVDDDITLSLTGGSVVLTPTNPTICSGGSVTLNASGSNTYTWSPGTGLNQTTGPTVIASPTVTTTYTVTGVVPGCTTTNTITVNVGSNILPTFTQLGPYCVGATPGTLPTTSINGFTGTWNSAISTASAGTTVYTFTPTAGQCASTATMSVVVNANITPTFTQLGPYCVGASPGILQTTSTNGITGTWNAAISTASVGTTVYTFTPTAGQCATTATMSVVVNTNNTPTFTQLGPYCTGAAPGALPTTSTNGITGTWSPATVSTATAGNTTYTFTPTAGQCAGTTTMTITIDASPTVTVPANIIVCNTGNVPATNFVSNPAGATFTWTNSNPAIGIGGNGAGNIPAFTATNAGNSPITATISVTPTLNTCVGTPSSYTITVNPTPTVMVPANIIVCNGAQIVTTNFTSPVSGATFTWTNSNTAIGLSVNGTGNIPAFNATNTGTAPITATITVTPSANNCTGTPSTYTITVNPTPTVVVPTNIVVCPGAVVTGSAFTSPTTGTTYTWTNSNTAIGLPGSGVGDVPTFSATNTNTGAIIATITVTPTANTCPGTPSSYTITVNPLPVITFSPMPQLCVTSPEFVLTQASPSGGTYSGTGITGTSFSPATAGIGTHTITYNYTDPVTGCSNNASTQIAITAGLTITVTPNNPFYCAGGSVLLTAAGATDFTWQPNIGLSATTGGNVIASPNSSTIYTVLGSNPDGCNGSTTVAVGVYTVPTLSIIAFPNEGCSPLDVTFSYSPAGPIDTNSLQWNFGDLASIDNTSDLINPEHIYNYEGSYTVYVSAATNDGCPVAATDTVSAYHKPIADFYFNPEVGYMDDPEIGFVDISVGANAWSWNFGNPASYNLNYSVLQNPYHTYTDTGTYIVELIVSSSHNCSDTVEKPVTIYPSVVIYIPNAFTPNGDILNDTWKPVVSGIDKDNYHLYIYDRWGKVMFATNDINEGWDGKYNEKPCPEAVYVYMIDYNTKPAKEHKVIRGGVTLVK